MFHVRSLCVLLRVFLFLFLWRPRQEKEKSNSTGTITANTVSLHVIPVLKFYFSSKIKKAYERDGEKNMKSIKLAASSRSFSFAFLSLSVPRSSYQSNPSRRVGRRLSKQHEKHAYHAWLTVGQAEVD